MSLYMVLFFMGFILAVGLLAYTSTQVAELSKKTDIFGKSLVERYSKSLKELNDKKEKDLDEIKDVSEIKSEVNAKGSKKDSGEEEKPA